MPETVPLSTNSAFGLPAQEIVIVSGLPRSGTSMMMKMLAAGGIQPLTDEVRRADPDNPEGYFEFEQVKQLDKGNVAWLPQAYGKAVKVISALLPYLPATHQYQLIFMERHINEILASQAKMLARRGQSQGPNDDKQMAAVFEKHLLQTKSLLSQSGHIAVLYVNYSAVLEQPDLQAKRIQEFLHQPVHLQPMVAAVNARLYRNRSG